jgi:hypothetical protein
VSIVVHGSHHVVSSRFADYELDRTLGLVDVVDLSIKVLVQLATFTFIKVLAHILSYIY